MPRVQRALTSASIGMRGPLDRAARVVASAAALVLAASAALVTGCEPGGPIRIGVVMDSSAIIGAELAQSQINASGGVDGHPLELKTVSEPYTLQGLPAMATAERLAADPSIVAVVGHSNSAASLAAAQVYNAQHVVQIAPNSTTELYRDAGPYSFRLVSGDDQQAVFLTAVLRRFGRPRVALLYVNDDYGRPLSMALRRDLVSANVPLVYEAPHVQIDSSDDAPTMAALRRTRPEVIVWVGRPDRLARMRPALRAALPDVRIIGSDGMEGTIVQLARVDVFTGIMYVSLLDQTARDTALVSLRQRYRAVAPGDLTDGAAFTYDAVMLLANGMRSGAHSREGIRRYLESLGAARAPYRGATGAIGFDANGDVASSYHLVRVTGDGRVPVDTAVLRP